MAAIVALGLAAACGDDDETAGGGAKPTLTVSAAASLKDALTRYGREFADAEVKLQFAGSDELAAQIEQGVKPDVYAAANTSLPEALYGKGLVDRPRVFAGNQLVIAAPGDAAGIGSIDDLAREGTKIAIGAESVPVGSYTRELLSRLPGGQERAILDNVRSEEPDVKGIVGKLAQGAVDAGFVYVSDVRAADGALEAIELEEDLQPAVAYGAAVVTGAEQPEIARRFIDGLIDGKGQEALQAAGFEPPPGQ